MNFFEQKTDRSVSNSVKWNMYPNDVLPMWVADMDFKVADPIYDALRARLEERVFGYDFNPRELKAVIIDRLDSKYGWRVDEHEIVSLPGVVPGFNIAVQELVRPGEGLLVQTPVYRPILKIGEMLRRKSQEMLLSVDDSGRYFVDMDFFREAITEDTRMFLLCNPHNPVGRVFSRAELEAMADECERNDIIICSDEIHCDITYEGVEHIPVASISPEVAERSITLMSPGKTFNIPGLNFAFAIVQNSRLRKRIKQALPGSAAPETNIMGSIAALAAYRECAEWHAALLEQLQSNRDYICDFVAENLDGVRLWRPEGTYLAWMDFRKIAFPESKDPYEHLLQAGRVALNPGSEFGPGGNGFARLNFGCPRAILTEGLERIALALRKI